MPFLMPWSCYEDLGTVRKSGMCRSLHDCFFPPTDLLNFGEPSQNIIDLMQRQGGSVDPSFQFYDFDAKTGVRRPLTAREDVLRILSELSPVTHVTANVRQRF